MKSSPYEENPTICPQQILEILNTNNIFFPLETHLFQGLASPTHAQVGLAPSNLFDINTGFDK